MPRTRRSLSPQFKAQTVLDLLSGVANPAEICLRHNLSPQLLARWKSIALKQLHCLFEKENRPTPELSRRRT
jgi:transposase-like protein